VDENGFQHDGVPVDGENWM